MDMTTSPFRLLIEEGLSFLPFNEKTVITPTGEKYKGFYFLYSR
jgi:hypothetical protein